MVAEFKSHVLLREEKGFLGVPFKRLLLAGVGGGVSYTLGKLSMPDSAVLLTLVVAVLLVVLSAPQGGIPRWQRLLYRLRGYLMLAAVQRPDMLMARIAGSLELPSQLVRLDSRTLFAPPYPVVDVNLAEWVTFAEARDADHDDGLVFVDHPLVAGPAEGR